MINFQFGSWDKLQTALREAYKDQCVELRLAQIDGKSTQERIKEELCGVELIEKIANAFGMELFD